MAIYTITKVNTALSTTLDSLTLIAAASRRFKVLKIYIVGGAAASAANEVGVYRATAAGVTPTGAITPQPVESQVAAAQTTTATGWTTQPTLGNPPLVRGIVNSNGGVLPWLPAKPGAELVFLGGETMSIRSISGTGLVTIEVTIEE